MKRFRPRLTYANVIASLALFIALGGAAMAAGLPKSSVGPQQLKNGAVTAKAIRKQAVTSGKIAPKAVVAGKLGPNAVLPGNLGAGIIDSTKISASAVTAEKIKNNVITTPKLNNGAVTSQKIAGNGVATNNLAEGAVTTGKIANGAVTKAKLSSEVFNNVETLKSTQTLRGVFDLGGTAVETGDTVRSSITFQQALANTATVTVLAAGETTANCGGLGTGGTVPTATGGNLCIYVTASKNLAEKEGLIAEANSRLGTGLVAKAKEGGVGKEFFASGVWAVTAP
jgi:trimeric autotransporter adhesin